MKYIEYNNGLKIICYSMPNTHSISLGLYVRAGSIYETSQNSGITHLLEQLHFRELCDLSQEDLYYEMESIGTSIDAKTYPDFIKFSMKVCPRFFKECLSIFKKLICANTWSTNSLNLEKSLIKQKIQENNSFFSTESIAKSRLYKNSPYANSLLGNPSIVDSFTLADIVNYKNQVFNKNNMIVCISGCFSEDDKKLLEEELSSIDIPDGSKNIPPLYSVNMFNRKPDIYFENDVYDNLETEIYFDVDLSKIKINDLLLLNCILGEGIGSRLQKTIKEKLTLASDISSDVQIYENFANIRVHFSIQMNEFNECFKKVIDVISNMMQTIDKKDLEVSLPFYTDNLQFLEDDTAAKNFELAYNHFIINKEKQINENSISDHI